MTSETDIQYEVWQDGSLVAFSDDIPDAQHFMAVYGQDGPVEAKTAVTVRTPGFNARTPAPEGEVVAWRYRYPNESKWQLTPDHKQAHDKTGEAQPLYASPVVPVGVREADLNELRVVCDVNPEASDDYRITEADDLPIGVIRRILAALGTKGADHD